MLVDSHCHLDYPEFEDLSETNRRASEAGVGAMLTIATAIDKFPGVLSVAESQPNIWATVGVHPHSAGKGDMVTFSWLMENANHSKVIGFGETGLDYFYEHSPREAQQQAFRTHIAAARERQLPLIVHTRDAEEDTLAILHNEMEKGAFPGLIHCFSASSAFAQAAVSMGLYISISGIITFKKADELRDAVAHVPLDRLLVETDAPYLAPIPHRGQPNEPAYTRHTAEKLAEIKYVSYAELETATTNNFFKLFTKAERPAE
ncbi:TatD family hydrolase [Magnetovibrio sp. PR-2]|uniref:TatD family hydrolase n=1 Tax=Magnetovibrio sp. PR-2 TaxID=3120356 RepID=UPI002FCE2B3E